MRLLFTLIFSSLYLSTSGQSLCTYPDTTFTVLHFTKTTGHDHNTRNPSNTMFIEIGNDNQFTIVNTSNSDAFDNLATLNSYSAIIFSNTSGNQLFNQTQKDNFEAYINQGGSFIGIHAATDTYRTGWPFYNNLVGAIVQSGPNHTSNSHNNDMIHQSKHEVLNGIPDPWNKTEEYYYWDINGGDIQEDSIGVLLKVKETGSDDYDRERPITWLRTFDNGARSFYTALGHAPSNYSNDDEFKQLLTNAVCWAAYKKSDFIPTAPEIKIQNSNLVIENQGNSIIMKAPNGSCHKLVVDNSGQLTAIPVKCVED